MFKKMKFKTLKRDDTLDSLHALQLLAYACILK
jgi:hypothetical protein